MVALQLIPVHSCRRPMTGMMPEGINRLIDSVGSFVSRLTVMTNNWSTTLETQKSVNGAATTKILTEVKSSQAKVKFTLGCAVVLWLSQN